jgi:membrane protein
MSSPPDLETSLAARRFTSENDRHILCGRVAPVGKRLEKWRRVVVETFSKWFAHDAMSQSAALAYYTVFSLAPLLIVVISIAGSVYGEDAVRGRIVRQFQELLGREEATFVQTVLQKAKKDASGPFASALAVLVLIIGASAVFAQLQTSLNGIWEVKPKKGRFFRDFIRKRVLTFALVLGFGFLLLVSLVLSAGVEAVQTFVADRFSIDAAGLEWANGIVSFLLFTVLFAMIFRILPDAQIPWRDVWHGAIATAILFVVGKWAIGLYLGRAAVASAYGAAGSVVVLLVWVYFTSLIVLLGAEFTRAYAKRLEKIKAPPEAGAKKQPPRREAP